MFAAHFMPPVGTVFRFVTQGNVVVERTMTSILAHPDYEGNPVYYPDVAVGVLDSDVPGTIAFAKILPAGWKDYFPPQSDYKKEPGVPMMVLDQEEKALVCNTGNISEAGPKPAPQTVYYDEPHDSVRAPFYEETISGDSGDPVFWVVDGELVLLSVLTSSSNGSDIQAFTDDINTMMTTLGGGYQLTPIDLSKYAST